MNPRPKSSPRGELSASAYRASRLRHANDRRAKAHRVLFLQRGNAFRCPHCRMLAATCEKRQETVKRLAARGIELKDHVSARCCAKCTGTTSPVGHGVR